MKTNLSQDIYVVAERRITGTRAEMADEIDRAVQELLEIKLLVCKADNPAVRFLAVPRRSHWVGVTITILALFMLLVLLLSAHTPRGPLTADRSPLAGELSPERTAGWRC